MRPDDSRRFTTRGLMEPDYGSKVSIITPCYNAQRFVGETIRSVRNQTFTNWEHVIVDDGSTDGSSEIVSALSDEIDGLSLITQPNGGTARARNVGYRASAEDSDYVLFLDADDYLDPCMLEVLVSYLDEHPSVGMVFCRYVEVDECGSRLPGWEHMHTRYAPTAFDVCALPPEEAETPVLTILTTSTTVPIPSQSLIRRSVYERTPGFDEELVQGCEDADLFLHVALRSTVHYVPDELVFYRQHPAQWSLQGQQDDPPQRRFARKWRGMEGLTRAQKKELRRSWQYWRTRVIPRIWWRAGIAALQDRRLGKGVLLCGGAAARYLFSPISIGWGGLQGKTYSPIGQTNEQFREREAPAA